MQTANASLCAVGAKHHFRRRVDAGTPNALKFAPGNPQMVADPYKTSLQAASRSARRLKHHCEAPLDTTVNPAIVSSTNSPQIEQYLTMTPGYVPVGTSTVVNALSALCVCSAGG